MYRIRIFFSLGELIKVSAHLAFRFVYFSSNLTSKEKENVMVARCPDSYAELCDHYLTSLIRVAV